MEIKYQSDFMAKDRSYSVGTVNFLSGYAVQVLDPRPRLAEGKLAPGELCMILFGISKEEHDLKDTDPKALKDLVSLLREKLPKDRVIGTLVVDLTLKPVKKTVRVEAGESIDNGEFANRYRIQPGPIDTALLESRKLQNIATKKDAPAGVREDWNVARKAAAQELLGVERLYVPYDMILRSRYPYVRDGRVELFTDRVRADKAMTISKRFNLGEDAWDVKEISSAEFPAFLDRCAEMGLNSLRIDAGTLDVLLFIKDICERETPRNAALRGCILQEIACGAQFEKIKGRTDVKEPDRRRLLERVMTMRNFSQRELGNSIIWTLCRVPQNASGRLSSKNAKEKMDNDPGFSVVDSRDCILLGTKGSDQKFLAAFTSEIQALAFAEKVNDGPRPVAMTFDDIAEIARKSEQANGLLIDVETIGYRVPKAQFDNIFELRSQPPKIVKIKAPEEAAKPAAAPQPERQVVTEDSLPDPDLGELPDPDADEVENAQPVSNENAETGSKEAEKTPEEDVNNGKKEKGGFFRKLFGKGKI